MKEYLNISWTFDDLKSNFEGFSVFLCQLERCWMKFLLLGGFFILIFLKIQASDVEISRTQQMEQLLGALINTRSMRLNLQIDTDVRGINFNRLFISIDN